MSAPRRYLTPLQCAPAQRFLPPAHLRWNDQHGSFFCLLADTKSLIFLHQAPLQEDEKLAVIRYSGSRRQLIGADGSGACTAHVVASLVNHERL